MSSILPDIAFTLTAVVAAHTNDEELLYGLVRRLDGLTLADDTEYDELEVSEHQIGNVHLLYERLGEDRKDITITLRGPRVEAAYLCSELGKIYDSLQPSVVFSVADRASY